MTIVFLPNAFAYNQNEDLIDGEAAVSCPVEPAGLATGHPAFKNKVLFLSLAGDHVPDGGSVRVRVAIHDGTGYQVEKYEVKSGARLPVKVPNAKNGSAYGITVGRMMSGPDASEGETTAPVSLLITVA